MYTQFIFTYKPKSLDEMVLNPATRAALEGLTGNNLSFILYGPPGCGKTCFVDILLSEPDVDFLKIRVAHQTADYIRNELRQYCSSVFNYTGKNYVVFNECDKLSKDAQTMLKEEIETFAQTNRFVFITNKIENMNKAIVSRLVSVEFKNPVRGNVNKHFRKILACEGLELDHKANKIINKCLSDGYTDFRKILNELENFYLQLA
jgi:replication-associated recombination protein RarA